MEAMNLAHAVFVVAMLASVVAFGLIVCAIVKGK